jgi:Tol biopolymer transport system component
VPGRKRRTAWFIAALVILIVAAGIWVLRLPVPSPHEVRFEFTTPPTSDTVSLAISPDGQQIAFVAASDGRSRLWVRSLDSVSTRSLAGTDGGFYPFWSPDSRSVGFFADGNLKRIDISTGLVQVLATAPNPLGGTWNRDGTILFAPNFASPIFRVSSTPGGESAAVTRIEAPPASHRFPQFLPDGRHFLYYVSGSDKARGVYVGQLDGPVTQRLLDADAAAVFASSEHILFIRQGKLIAQAFDPSRLMLRGNPLPVAEGVSWSPETRAAGVSASSAGPIVYRMGQAAGERQFVWFDRSGKEIQRVGEPDSADPQNPSMCERKVAMGRSVIGNPSIWILNLDRGLRARFTFDMASDVAPVWSPDCSQIVFSSDRNGRYDLYLKSATGAGSEELLLPTKQNKSPLDWSRDGRFVLYRSPGATTGFDLWAVPVQGERKPFPVAQTDFNERDGQFSPDGNWVAYQSNESGSVEIVIQPFPGPGGKMPISRNGGAQVRWRLDGKELFYIALNGRLMAVPIQLASNGRSFEAGDPEPLFMTKVGGAEPAGPTSQQYAVSADGQRFLMNTVVTDVNASPISVILNWQAGSLAK